MLPLYSHEIPIVSPLLVKPREEKPVPQTAPRCPKDLPASVGATPDALFSFLCQQVARLKCVVSSPTNDLKRPSNHGDFPEDFDGLTNKNGD